MEDLNTYSQRFVTNLFNFISDVSRYTDDENCKAFLELYEKLDMNKLLIRFVNVIGKHEDKLQNKDDSLFNSCIIPGIDFSIIWPKLTESQKNKCWTHLQILFLNGNIVIKRLTSKSKQEKQQNKTQESQEFDFNPYIGVGSNDTTYSVNDVTEGPKNMELDPLATPGIESMTKLFGIDKMIDLDKLQDQLENMTEDDLNEQTESIKKLLGVNLDDKNTSLISGMLGDITNELKNKDFKKANPFELIHNVASSVSEKLKHSVSEADMEHLFKATNMGNMNNMGGFNPMSILSKINLNDKKSVENLLKNPEQLHQLVEESKKEEERLAAMSNKDRLRQKIKNKSQMRQSRK